MNSQSFILIDGASAVFVPIQSSTYDIGHRIVFPEKLSTDETVGRPKMSLHDFMTDYYIVFAIGCGVNTKTIGMKVVC